MRLIPATLLPLALCASATLAFAANEPDANLPVPDHVVVDAGLSQAQQARMMLAARRYYAFWNKGEASLAKAALASDFTDRTLPAGRPQGVAGPLFASEHFRAAVPDLSIHVEEMLLVGDRVVGRLHFTGHFTGTFGQGEQARHGDGRAVDFIATDIYRIKDGQISDNWHLEDNLTLMQQLGVVAQ